MTKVVLDELQVPEADRASPIRGRPTIYTDDLALTICERLACGELLIDIVQDVGVGLSTIFRWREERPNFREIYARAREMQGHACAERAVRSGRSAQAENAVAARVHFDADRWFAAKLLPKVYGEQKEPPVTVVVDDDRRTSIRQELLRQLGDLAKPAPLTITEDGDDA